MSSPRRLEFLSYTDPPSGVRGFGRESCLLALGVGLGVVVVVVLVLVMPLLSMCSLYVLAVLSVTLPVELCSSEPLAG